MLHALLDLLRRDMDKKLALAFPTPALRKRREGQGTHCVGDASEIKSLGHPPKGKFRKQQVLKNSFFAAQWDPQALKRGRFSRT